VSAESAVWGIPMVYKAAMKHSLLLLSLAIPPIGWPQLDAVCELSPRVWSFACTRSAFSTAPADCQRRR